MANDDVLAASAPFTTVGIGASAGGLGALEFKPAPEEARFARATRTIKLISRPISVILTDLNRPGMAQVGREVPLGHTKPQAAGDGLS